MTDVLRVKNWSKYQGYQKRGPTWVKLYASLLSDPSWILLPVEAKALLPALWLVAAGQSTAGTLPADVRMLAILTHVSESEVCRGLNPLISFGFIQCDGSVAGLATEPSGEKRRDRGEERRGENVRPASPVGGSTAPAAARGGWTGRVMDMWPGVVKAGRLGAALGPVRDRYGEEPMLAGLKRWLAAGKAGFGPEVFAADAEAWIHGRAQPQARASPTAAQTTVDAVQQIFAEEALRGGPGDVRGGPGLDGPAAQQTGGEGAPRRLPPGARG